MQPKYGIMITCRVPGQNRTVFDGRVNKTNRLVVLISLVCLNTAAAAPRRSLDYVPGEILVKFRPAVADKLGERPDPAATGRLSLSARLDTLNRKYGLVTAKPVFPRFRQNRKRLQQLQARPEKLLDQRQKRILRRLRRAPAGAGVPQLHRIYKLQFDLRPGQSLQELLEAYNRDPAVEYAELNYTVEINRRPNDPLFPVQWPLDNTGQMYPSSGKFRPPPGTPDADIDAPGGWNFITSADDVVVAVIDTGIDYTHRDLAHNVWVNLAERYGRAGVDDDGNGYVDDVYGYDFINDDPDPRDDNGHGTHCAGVIAAEGDNGLDITGLCWRGKIMGLKCLGSDGRGNIDDAAEAVYYAVENGAEVISNSWGAILGFGGFPKVLIDAFDYAHSQGVISVASAGNQGSTNVNFPAIFDNVISVAATDSNDDLAIFSNYGEYVDIAAPGVDVLSLRAAGTSRATPYNDYTTIDSGTSMACPHVAGAVALVLAYYPDVYVGDVTEIIFNNTNWLPPEICRHGRLNLYRALAAVADYYAGKVVFRRDVYSCDAQIQIILNDLNLIGCGTQDVNVTTEGGDLEIVTLAESNLPGVYEGKIWTQPGPPTPADGLIQLSHGEKITVTYYDQDDGTGTPAVARDTAVADCRAPVITNVQIDAPGPEPTVTFDTNEPTTAFVLAGPACGGPYSLQWIGSTLATHHTVKLLGIQPYTRYFFVVQAFDAAENQTIEDNNGLCYEFTTTGPADIYVPEQYPDVQQAIYRAWDTSTIWLADGIYTGPGNCDIDFLGRAVMLRSRNGPENCIIDCNGEPNNPRSGFHFTRGEDANSVLQGITITGGYVTDTSAAGAVTCISSSPSIVDCVLVGNTAPYGGAIRCEGTTSSPLIKGCTLAGNTALYGAGIYSVRAAPTVANCIIAGNSAETGAGVACRFGAANIINCTIVGNRAQRGGGIVERGDALITNTILWDNRAEVFEQLVTSTPPTYCCIQGGCDGLGNITADPCFVHPGWWDPNGTAEDPNDDFWVQGDYHLKSSGWRWSTDLKLWTWDDVTSRCIDAGNPAVPLQAEPVTLQVDPLNRAGVNRRINIGAYGGTETAAIGPYGWSIQADLDNNGRVDWLDLACLSGLMLHSGWNLPADLDRNGIINMADFAVLADHWALQTTWHGP